jgi:hypothetical protein
MTDFSEYKSVGTDGNSDYADILLSIPRAGMVIPFFFGLSKPRVPTQMVAILDQSLMWCHI